MAITLNLKHTFTTRVVYSTEEVADLRAQMESQLELAEKYIGKVKDPRQLAKAKAGIALIKLTLTKSDEEMVKFVLVAAFKDGVAKELQESIKEIGVTRMSPIQTISVGPSKKPEVCGLHPEDKACTALCKRFTVTQ